MAEPGNGGNIASLSGVVDAGALQPRSIDSLA